MCRRVACLLMLKRSAILPLLAFVACSACGGAQVESKTLPEASPAPSASSPVHDTATTPAATASPQQAPHALVGPSSRRDPIPLEVVLPASTPASAFPKATAEESTCWKSVELIGDHDKDYESLISKCGEPTGMLPYTRFVESRLHDVAQGNKGDPRDFYAARLRGGMCYRFYAVADGSMVALDMHIYKEGGALAATAETRSPALIMQSLKPICVDHDGEWVFELDVDANGKGRYKFAVWARPAKG